MGHIRNWLSVSELERDYGTDGVDGVDGAAAFLSKLVACFALSFKRAFM